MRAGNGDGSIKPRKTKTKGTVWDVQVTVTLSTGLSERVTKRGFPDRKTATAWRDEQRRIARAAPARAKALTVPKLVEAYLDDAMGLEQSTRAAYARMLKLYIKPMLNMRVSTVKERDMQAFADGVTAKVKSTGNPGTATTLLALAAVRGAYAWGAGKGRLLDQNPMPDMAVQVAETPNGRRAFTRAEVQQLMLASTERSRPIWQLFLEAAPRAGELLALEWRDFDFAVNKVSFYRILTPESNYSQIAIRTKGKKARDAYISDELCATLRALKEEQGATGADPVFTTVRGPRRRLSMMAMRQLWWKDLKAANLSNRVPHELRHTWATNALANGVDVQTVADVLGHSDLSTVSKYLHMDKGGASVANALRASLGYD